MVVGGTCALNLAVKHPELFSAFVNIDEFSTTPSDRQQTDGGCTVVTPPPMRAGILLRSCAERAVRGRRGMVRGIHAAGHPNPPGDRRRPAGTATGCPCHNSELRGQSAVQAGQRIRDRLRIVIPETGKHDWPFAGRAFRSSLPWLAGRIGTPDVPEIPLPRNWRMGRRFRYRGGWTAVRSDAPHPECGEGRTGKYGDAMADEQVPGGAARRGGSV